MELTSIYIAASSVLAALISAFVLVRGQKTQVHLADRGHSNVEIQTIFDGYGQIVEELRVEVERLTQTITTLQEEQAACEERNNELISDIEQLKERICHLESTDGRE